MTHEDYAQHVKEFTTEMTAVTTAKNPDYSAGTDDAMGNYYECSEAGGITPIQAWSVLMMKHFTAIKRFIKTGRVSSEPIHGRFVDLANYAMLGDALVKDLENKKSVPPQDGLIGGHGEDL